MIKNRLIILLISVVFISSCSDNKPEVNENVESLPPSIAVQEETVSSVIELSDEQAGQLNIETESVKEGRLDIKIAAPANVFPAPENLRIISAPVSGRVVAINYHEGDMVSKGDILLEIESLDFANMVSEYLRALADKEYYSSNYNRLNKLAKQNISSRSDLEKAESELRRASNLLTAAHSKLLAIGISQKEMNAWANGADPGAIIKIRAGISGKLNEHLVDMGQAVNIYDKMLTIINPSKVMIKGFLSPHDASLVRPGDTAFTETLKGHEHSRVAGIIHSINPALDENNKSVVVNVMASPNNGWPRPGQSIRLVIDSKTDDNVIYIPVKAIVYDGDKALVFVKKSGNQWEKRYIEIKRSFEDFAVVQSGLKAGEEVAVSKIFNLKALARFEQFAD